MIRLTAASQWSWLPAQVIKSSKQREFLAHASPHSSKARHVRVFLRLTVDMIDVAVSEKRDQKKETPAIKKMAGVSWVFGAGEMNRTPDLLITNELLYRLSYTGLSFQL